MKRKMIIIFGLILLIIVSLIVWRYFNRTPDLSYLQIELPNGTKYIHKESNYGGFPPDGISYYIMKIPLEKNIEFENGIKQGKWIRYNSSLFDAYLNNPFGRNISDKIPFSNINNGWFIFFDSTGERHVDGDIATANYDNIYEYDFVIYDPDTLLLYYFNCTK